MSNPDILERIDDTLDDYETWNGHSPDAARWAGGPEEGEWPEGRYIGDLGRVDMAASLCSGQEAMAHREISSRRECSPPLWGASRNG